MTCHGHKICISLAVLYLALAGQIFAQQRCKITVSAINASNKESIEGVSYKLIDHQNLAATKKEWETEHTFEYDARSGYTIKAMKEGFFTSVVTPPKSCGATSEKLQILLVSGDSQREIFIAADDSPRNSDGKLMFDLENVSAIGKSWPKPRESIRCKLQCDVLVGIRIDKNGVVTYAKTISGGPIHGAAAEIAALRSIFKPVYFKGEFVPVNALMSYRFTY